MSKPVIPEKAKLFIGILTNSEDHLQTAEKRLIKKYGDIDLRTGNIQFTHTEYYNTIGKNLFKVLFSFKKLINRENITEIKLNTNNLENFISKKGKRSINIDPGYLTLSNVFLASCKDYFHRVYLKRGVYLENELKFINKRYTAWDWTYPDYKKPEYMLFFHDMRRIYYQQLRK